MKTIEIENALVINLVNEQIKMQSGEYRAKQNVFFTENTGNGVQMQECVVWDDNIGKLLLEQGKTFNISCRLVGRQWGGRISYDMVAFKAVKVEPKQEGGQEPAI